MYAAGKKQEIQKNRPIRKKWWLWMLTAIAVLSLVGIIFSSNPEPLELTDLSGGSKKNVIAKLGKPDEPWVIRDDEDDYYYMYPFGVTLLGNDEFVSEISLTYGEEGVQSNKVYSILGLTLGANFNDYIAQNPGVFQAPNLDLISQEGQRSRMYHDKQEDTILNLLTESDSIIGVRYVHYANSDESYTLDLANYIGNSVTEQQLMNELGITSTISGDAENTYYFGQTSMANWIKSDTKNDKIQEIMITDGRFFNIGGQRIGDSVEQATAALSNLISTTEEAGGVKVDTFELTVPNTLNDSIVAVRSFKGNIVSIQATSRSTYADSLLPLVEEEPPLVKETPPNTPTDTWPSLSLEQQIEFNQYFSEFSSVNFGTSPYIKDTAISSYSTDELIRFAIERNQKFGQDNSYSFNQENDSEMIMHQDLVAEVIDYFFGIQINHKSISGYTYKDEFYGWDAYRWAYMDSNLFSQVQRLLDNQDGTLTAEVGVFQDLNDYGYFASEDPDYLQAKSIRYQPQAAGSEASHFSYIGTVKAIIKKSETNDWIIIDYKVESMY
ncbi:hypothetical protein ASF12_25635 [Paenibacillus sp. Leaf72]|nr:hypothetical protein ASF12_25635 [Paenibacillus sp. Leaf72]